MPISKIHELEATTDGLVYITPASGKDPLGDAIRKNGGARAADELRFPRLRLGEAVVKRGYGSKATYLVMAAGPNRKGDIEEFEIALRECLDASEKYSLTSLTFGSWSLSTAGLPAITVALATHRVLDEWRKEHPRRVLKKIVFALHDEEGYEAFKRVEGLSAKARSEIEMSGSTSVWKVEKLPVVTR